MFFFNSYTGFKYSIISKNISHINKKTKNIFLINTPKKVNNTIVSVKKKQEMSVFFKNTKVMLQKQQKTNLLLHFNLLAKFSYFILTTPTSILQLKKTRKKMFFIQRNTINTLTQMIDKDNSNGAHSLLKSVYCLKKRTSVNCVVEYILQRCVKK